MRASGYRSRKTSVELPGPQPMSAAWTIPAFGIRATRSWTGRVRSCSNLTYWAADQVIAGVSHDGEPLSCDASPDGARMRRPCLRRRGAPNLRA